MKTNDMNGSRLCLFMRFETELWGKKSPTMYLETFASRFTHTLARRNAHTCEQKENMFHFRKKFTTFFVCVFCLEIYVRVFVYIISSVLLDNLRHSLSKIMA